MFEYCFQLGISKFCTKLGLKMSVCENRSSYFFCGHDNLLGGQFWAMGIFNLLGGQNNLLVGQLPTQLTCYLSPCNTIEMEIEIPELGRLKPD